MQNKIKKMLPGKAILEYSENPAFISFRLLNSSLARSAVNILAKNGINANTDTCDRRYIKIVRKNTGAKY